MRLILAISAILAVSCTVVAAAEQKIVDSKGKTIGVILDCNSCEDPSSGESCASGVQEGFHDGQPCGKCLLTANFGTKILYPYDLHMTGTLQQPDGKPLGDEFIRLFLPNTWTVRTRSMENGFYRLVLGATQDRQGETLKIDLGTRSRAKVEEVSDYALFMLPENYTPCSEE